jgi:hypothetical protein
LRKIIRLNRGISSFEGANKSGKDKKSNGVDNWKKVLKKLLGLNQGVTSFSGGQTKQKSVPFKWAGIVQKIMKIHLGVSALAGPDAPLKDKNFIA